MGDKIANKKKKAKADARPAKKPVSLVSELKPVSAVKGGKPVR
jgi:hypothetical protein